MCASVRALTCSVGVSGGCIHGISITCTWGRMRSPKGSYEFNLASVGVISGKIVSKVRRQSHSYLLLMPCVYLHTLRSCLVSSRSLGLIQPMRGSHKAQRLQKGSLQVVSCSPGSQGIVATTYSQILGSLLGLPVPSCPTLAGPWSH